ncbi:N-acetylmuramic acid 6-phosphate etherase [Aminobacter niigataensis]|uniref:N-acetylmuramic acid 6-phosphate etherase n=1 Tax=Aminobacter niigataensis TaxID=83265 RepID=UPI0024CC4661|nr:N-acetylmuramic acid 6-phosphate etherase [Aminobacter niigataensis]CAI2931650.1 N-acetylmuramic acid 6-phosphate etherase [Aminobacter niigataensis]
MAPTRTEAVHKDAGGIDAQAPESVLRLLAAAQVEAAGAVHAAIPAIAEAAAKIAERLAAGGRLVYAAAGSSGLMALADALELPGTFGIPRDRVVILLAGGTDSLVNLTGAPEDDAGQAMKEVAAAELNAGDCLIAISASGSTPFAIGALNEARRRGAATIAVANNAGAPMFDIAEISVLLGTPPEVVAGSTRMGAGTAQKIALNMMSTLVAVHLGHVHDGYMVNLHADNLKLHERAARIVSAISGCDMPTAKALLERSGGSVKVAILLASGAASPEAANQLLDGAGQKLRSALSKLEGSRGSHQ